MVSEYDKQLVTSYRRKKRKYQQPSELEYQAYRNYHKFRKRDEAIKAKAVESSRKWKANNRLKNNFKRTKWFNDGMSFDQYKVLANNRPIKNGGNKYTAKSKDIDTKEQDMTRYQEYMADVESRANAFLAESGIEE